MLRPWICLRRKTSVPFGPLAAALIGLVASGGLQTAGGQDLATLGKDPLGQAAAFEPPTPARLNTARSRFRSALDRLRSLLDRSGSGGNWRKYLDWPELERQATSADAADIDALAKLYRRLDSGATGLEMPEFAGVRQALGGYLEAVSTARNPEAGKVYEKRLERLASAVATAAAAGTPEQLDPVGPILARLEESGQGLGVVQRIRWAVNRPNLYLQVDESLLGRGVNQAVDETAPINEVLLGTRVRGTGHTTGLVFIDFQPAQDRAIVDFVLDATNHSRTRGGQGPVTVHTIGTTQIDARKRIFIDEQGITSQPVEADASVSTKTAGIGVSSKFGKRLIRKIASRKVAEMQPKARAISEDRARDRIRSQFEAQTAAPIAQAARDYQTKFRRRLMDRGWYPEMLHINSDDRRMMVTARKSLADQVAAFSQPPAVDPDAVLSARVHETFVNNLIEQELGGRTITKQLLEEQMKKANRPMPESLENDADQPPWSITFAKRKPVEMKVSDNTVRLTVHGSKYTSGDREFPAMDVWAAYKVGRLDGRICLVRDGDVQIYPPGFVPGGGEKLSVQETSLRRILQKRFNKVFDEVVEIEPLKLPGQLEAAGPLPLEQLDARKDGWLAAGWRKADPVIYASGPVMQETIISEEPIVNEGLILESAAAGLVGDHLASLQP
ncbi:MAG: hypothetical protein RLZZ440_2743 [Planctomycetota bacterium]